MKRNLIWPLIFLLYLFRTPSSHGYTYDNEVFNLDVAPQAPEGYVSEEEIAAFNKLIQEGEIVFTGKIKEVRSISVGEPPIQIIRVSFSDRLALKGKEPKTDFFRYQPSPGTFFFNKGMKVTAVLKKAGPKSKELVISGMLETRKIYPDALLFTGTAFGRSNEYD